MKYWIVPCKSSVFLIDAALRANKEGKSGSTYVDWRQSNDFSVGDVVFIYKTSSQSQIAYRMEVERVALSFDETTDKELFWKDKLLFYDGLGSHKYVRFRLVREYPKDYITFDVLRKHGLHGNIEGVMQCKNQELLDFLQRDGIDMTSTSSVKSDNSSLAEDSEYTEGEVRDVVQTLYERNRDARNACIAAKGYKCAVCGMDFEKTYGEIGKGFIHIHHVVPISSIGREYKIDPVTDLVPVCPNCHNMLHRKDPPYTIKELKCMLNRN